MAIRRKDETTITAETDPILKKIEESELKKKYRLPEKDKDAIISVSFPKNHKTILEEYWSGMGLNFSSGVRMVLYKYMRENIL